MDAPAYTPQIRVYQDWLAHSRGLRFESYDALWSWSVSDLDGFWQSVWDYFQIQSPTPHTHAFCGGQMPHARWFEGAQVNYAQQVFRHVDAAHAAGLPAIVSSNELGQTRELSWPELRAQVGVLAARLKDFGVQRGDRVAAYLPNVPEAMVAFLACSSIGAVWSLCAPDMGTPAVLDRFRQIEPKVLIAVDGVYYGGRAIDRSAVVQELMTGLPTVQQLVLLRTPHATNIIANCADFTPAAGQFDPDHQPGRTPEQLPFDHPVWIVYSSGTTGLPKPIVHGQGGIILAHLQLTVLHNDVGCSYAPNSFGERFHWYSSTGWVMWNAQMAGLLNGSTVCIFDGNPGGAKEQPDWSTLWRFAADARVTWFGAGAAFYANCMKAGVDLQSLPALARVRALGSTGSPLSEDAQTCFTKAFNQLGQKNIWWCNISGGTDFCGAFIGGHRELPLVPGQMQARLLGCAVQAWNESGEVVNNEVGELVCTQPIPSMPLYFWNDAGDARYLSSYFDTYPGVWRHGDWLRITPDGQCIIYGRSDATINRHGLRMGTSEIYSAVEALPEVLDSMVVDLEYLGRESFMPLFVVLREGLVLDNATKERINNAIKTALSPRFIPNVIAQAPEIPRTLSGKKQELPIKKLLLGQPLEKVVNQDAMANPGCLGWYVQYASEYQSRMT
jgi:acetoacetyl-CoA synthetase